MLLKSVLISVLVPYFIGSIPSAVWAGRFLAGKDVRISGSGNAGATNVYRVLGIRPAIFVFVLDFCKGMLVVWVCWKWNLSFPWIIVAASFVVLGHVYPFMAGFFGGKGVSTAAGVLALVDPLALIVALIVFGLIVWRFRLVSAASLTAGGVAFLTATAQIIFLNGSWVPVAVTGVFLAMILVTHRANLLRLKSGLEPRI